MRSPFPYPRPCRAGFALVDVCLSMAMLVVAMGILLGSTFSAMKLDQVNGSLAVANQALRGLSETVSAMSAEDALADLYVDPADGTQVADTKRARLAIARELLSDVRGEPLAAVARFPFHDDYPGELREDLVIPELGLPRDLNEDGVIDSENHRDDYRVLPVTLELAWESPAGPQTVRMSTLLRRP